MLVRFSLKFYVENLISVGSHSNSARSNTSSTECPVRTRV
jgi:hypothetical protein